MNNRTFVGDIQVSDLAPENRTFVQTQEATTVFRHLYKHRRRHYNVTVTWRHYYIRPVFPRHDKWRGTDVDRYLYSPSSDILMGAIFSSAATSDASRLPLQNIGGLKRWTMEYNINIKRSGDKSGTGNSGKTIVHTTPLCITLDNQDQVLFETNQDTWKSQSTKLFYSTTKNREMTDRLSRNLKLLKNFILCGDPVTGKSRLKLSPPVHQGALCIAELRDGAVYIHSAGVAVPLQRVVVTAFWEKYS